MSLILIFVVTVLHNIDTFWNETLILTINMSFMTKIKIFFFLKVILLCVVSSFCHSR